MAEIYLKNGKSIWTSLTIEELKSIQVNSKDFIEIKNEQVICSEYDNRQIKHEKKYFININNICYIEETISNYINDEKSI